MGDETSSPAAEPSREQTSIVRVGREAWAQSFAVSHKVRLVHILKNLHTSEAKIYSDASREFVELLGGESGGQVLQEFVQQSPRLVELVEAWRLHREQPGMACILSLFAAILGHPEGKLRRHGLVKKNLDAVARVILEDKEKWGDVMLELSSGDPRRQNAALDLLAAIVRRGVGLASEVAERFDFKMDILPQLAGTLKKKKGGGRDGGNRRKAAEVGSTRRSFIGFAMSFLEVGSPRLLRWVLQQRELYSGVLRGIGNDDAETITYVFSTLRDNVLVEESLVPPGLRSVLFGSATLEQLSLISGNLDAGEAADIAHEVLVMVCTDPKNGLMPGTNLRGNEKRLLDLMKKLRATEVAHHRSLLLAIVSKRMSLCSAYINEFPFSIEPRSSPSWFAAITLAADVISSAKCDSIVHTLSSNSHGLVSVDDEEVQVVLKCIVPHVCSRAVINRGLLHSDDLVKHGSLRLVFESVNLLCHVIEAINGMIASARVKSEFDGSTKVTVKVDSFPALRCSEATDATLIGEDHQGDEVHVERWISLREYIQDEVRAAMPDPQVLLKLLSSANQKHQNYSMNIGKNGEQLSEPPQKKRRCDASSAFEDIIIGGIDIDQDKDIPEDLDLEKDHTRILCDIWGLEKQGPRVKDAKVIGDVFHSKLLDVLKLYLRVMPSSFDGSFDFFRVIPPNPLDLSNEEQSSLLSLLLEYSGQSEGCWDPERIPESMYKHLQPLVYIMLHSPTKSTRDQAHILVKAAMASSGAFDLNFAEIDAWLVFLPGYEAKWSFNQSLRVGASNRLSHIVIPFIYDAISLVGNNLYKYQEHMRKLITRSGQFEGCSPAFSPLIMCVLQKCLRLLDSESGSMKLHEKCLISLYVCNTISLILQSQVDVQLLRDLLSTILSERFDKFSFEEMNSRICLAEWRPLINLLHFLRRISGQQTYSLLAAREHSSESDANSLRSVIRKVEEIISQQQANSMDDVATAFLFSVISAAPEDIISVFPDLLAVLKTHFPCHLAFLSSVFYLQHDYLAKVATCWPDMLCSFRLIKDDFSFDNMNTVEDIGLNPVSAESAPMSAFLSVSPFYVLLPSVLRLASAASDEIREAYDDTLLRLLQDKLSKCSLSELTLDLRSVLFWSYHLLSLYAVDCSNTLEQLCHLCSALLDGIFERIQVLISDTTHSESTGMPCPIQHIQNIVDSVLHHPIVALSLSCSVSSYQDQNLTNGRLENLDEILTAFSKEKLHHRDRYVLNVLSKLYDLLLMVGRSETSYSREGLSLESLFTTPKLLVDSVLTLFKEKFRLCMDKSNLGLLLPNFCMVRTLSKFVSPTKLLEHANWMFTKLDNSISTSSPAFVPGALVCLYIADVAMEMLYFYLQQSDQRQASSLLWDLEIHNSDIIAIQRAYHSILHFATKLNLEFADHCLLKMLGRIHHTGNSPGWSTDYAALHMIFSTMAMNTPIDILHHCILPTSVVKAKAVFLLLEASAMHMSLFGQVFMEVLEKYTSVLQAKDSSNALGIHEDGAILLLPAALSYLNCNIDGNGRFAEFLEPIPIFYCGLLLGDNGFLRWKDFVSRSVFEEDFTGFAPASFKETMIYFSETLLGKSVKMLNFYFIIRDMSQKKRLEIIASIFPESSELLASEVDDINPTAGRDIIKLVNELFAKIILTRLLLFPRKSSSKELESERESKRLNKAKLNFIGILVKTLDKIVRNFPSNDSILSQPAKEHKAISFLEYAILKNIIELSSEIQTHLNHLKSIPFLNQFVRSSLLHRFSDPITINAIRCILVVLSQGNVPADEILELVLGHSSFVSIIACCEFSEHPSACNTVGGLLQPCPSILKFIDSSCMEEKKPLISVAEKRRIETIRLLRLLYDLKSRQQNNTLLNESRELVFLLLSVYGATLGDTDLEIFHLMNEIESSELRIVAEVDHLWGSAALKFREELKLDFSKLDAHDTENVEITERRKALFRENIPVDSKLCAKTALQYCYKRSSRASAFSLEQLRRDSFVESFEVTSQRMDMAQIYDPIFILRFSIHTLLMGYLEPIEFSRLGLLAITLVSIASPDQDLRMLGYESLGIFKKSLEASQKSKETWQLQLLLTYLQNGISEQWQRIPSIVSVFAAEASLTLVDSSNTQFTAISNFLMHSTSVNLQSIPLFPALLRSSSVHFKAERLWMLRLLYVGSNLSDDAKIYKRGTALELALSFSSSPVSDSESKVLVLKVLKKSVKLPVLAHHLVKDCGLLLWLSSVVSTNRDGSDDVENTYFKVTELALEVVIDLIASRLITDWLQETALEQLSAISSHLYVLLDKDTKFLKENVSLLISVLRVITSTMRLSMKRKTYQPHFTLSLHGIFSICQTIGGSSRSMGLRPALELGIDAILMNGPLPIFSETDKSRISIVVSWAILNIFWLQSNQSSVLEMPSEESVRNESLLSKILRWLVASVILGRISSISHGKNLDLRGNTNSLEALGCFLNGAYEKVTAVDNSSANDTLATTILYLQNHVQKNCDYLPSVVIALHLLLLDTSSKHVNKLLRERRDTVEMLFSKIRCPSEFNPAWRWHFYQPWKDPALQKTEIERIEEEQACRSLLIIFSNAFGAGVSDFPKLSLNDVEKSGLFRWEKDSIVRQP